ncbi:MULTISPECIES: PH domain-containing protein [Nocardiopsis]|uniref:PH domain-containing protein n=1 Tax=Nocardiopsis TaxID=2013 RepID=UPI000346D20C
MDTSEPTSPAPEGSDPPRRPVDAAFAAPGDTDWTRVPVALAWYRRLVTGACCLAVGAAGALFLFLSGRPGAAVTWAVAVLVAAVVLWLLAGRFQRSWGYAEESAELYLTYGVLMRQLVVVPYGRMQVVDVTADLLEQALGIATVRVRTAASTADTRVVGLPLADAVQLRDRLAARSETFSTGL